jgi:hypothetical protein
MEIKTKRLLLRRWRAGDREPFARLNEGHRLRRHVLYRLRQTVWRSTTKAG